MIYLLLAILGSASMTIILKVFREQKGNRYGILLGNYLTCILISFMMLPDKHQVIAASPVTLVCGTIDGFLFVAGLVLMQSSVRANGAILTAAFSKLGLVVPLTLSILLMGERPQIRQMIGIVLVLCAILYMQMGGKKERENPAAPKTGDGKTAPGGAEILKPAPILLILTMLSVGCSDSMAKVFERIGERSEDALLFFYVFLTAAILTAVLAFREKMTSGKSMIPKEMLAGVVVGIPNYFSSALLLAALTKLPGFIVYTAFSTGTILLVTLVSAAAFRERLKKSQIIGMGVILVALVLLNL